MHRMNKYAKGMTEFMTWSFLFLFVIHRHKTTFDNAKNDEKTWEMSSYWGK